MVFQHRSSQTGIPDSQHISGRVSSVHCAPIFVSTQLTTLRPTDSQRGRFRFWRICYALASSTLEGPGRITYLLLSSPTIIASRPASGWNPLRRYMADHVDHHSVGLTRERAPLRG